MSKQEKAKQSQGYEPKPVVPMCSNCVHYLSDYVEAHGWQTTWTEEKNIRCGIGGFAVKKQGKCSLHELKTTP